MSFNMYYITTLLPECTNDFKQVFIKCLAMDDAEHITSQLQYVHDFTYLQLSPCLSGISLAIPYDIRQIALH